MRVLSHEHPLLVPKPEDKRRYPFHIPEWFWERHDNAFVLDSDIYMSLKQDCAKLALLQSFPSKSAEADVLDDQIAKQLASRFCLRDLAQGAKRVNGPANLELAVQVDPAFESEQQERLVAAARWFLKAALEIEVLRKALARASDTPCPMPQKFELKGGATVVDDAGRSKYSEGYSFYLQNRIKPTSVAAFVEQMRDALCSKRRLIRRADDFTLYRGKLVGIVLVRLFL